MRVSPRTKASMANDEISDVSMDGVSYPDIPSLKRLVDAAQQAHARVVVPMPYGLVQVSQETWSLIAQALKETKALHDLDASKISITNKMSIDGDPERDQHVGLDLHLKHVTITAIEGRVQPDDKKGRRATVTWASIGATGTDSARSFALGILRVADCVDAGLAKKLEISADPSIEKTKNLN